MKIKVPEGMPAAARVALGHGSGLVDVIQMHLILTAALEWLSQNPIVPTPDQAMRLRQLAIQVSGQYGSNEITAAACAATATEWQRTMFLPPEEELPAEVQKAIHKHFGVNPADWVKELAIDAYRLGQQNSQTGKLEGKYSFMDSALKQCVCGHEQHDGKCGKPRYSTTDTCPCKQFVDATPKK